MKSKQIKDKSGRFVAISGWGSCNCDFCNQKVVAYNLPRHQVSKRHLDNIKLYEEKHNVVIIENIHDLSTSEIKKVLKNKMGNGKKKLL